MSAAVAVCAAALSVSAHAASLGVSPTLIDVKAGAVSGVRVRNGDTDTPVNVQARLLRWRQEGGDDVYTPAEGVAASPPLTRIAPGSEHLIRIVRTAAHPVAGEESYRLLVDELPVSGQAQAGVINMLIRHSVPVFFSTQNAAPAQPQWRIARAQQEGEGGTISGWQVSVSNLGDKRLRLANLQLYDDNDTLVAQRDGLVGYVLGRSRMDFFIADKDTEVPVSAATALRLSAQSEHGSIDTGLLSVTSP